MSDGILQIADVINDTSVISVNIANSSLASPLPQVPLVPTDEVVVQSRM